MDKKISNQKCVTTVMERFFIPAKEQKQVQQLNSGSCTIHLEAKDLSLIKEADPIVQSVIQTKFNEINQQDLMKINNIVELNYKEKAAYFSDLNETFVGLMSSLEKHFSSNNSSNKKQFKAEVAGRYKSDYSTPSLEYWKNSNPAKSMAIDVFFDELRKQGWNPINRGINNYTVDHDDGMYYGGHVVTLFCDFQD
jgi:hypothetical protein